MSSESHPSSDEDIRAVVERLSRPHRTGGRVIERAAILAEGPDSAAILEWLAASSWTPEEAPEPTANRGGGGLHGARRESERGGARPQAPRRYFSPAPNGA